MEYAIGYAIGVDTMSSDLVKIVKLLPRLSTPDLDELMKRINALRQFGSSSAGDADYTADESFVLDAITRTLRSDGTSFPSLLMLQKAVTEKLDDNSSFRDKIPGLMAFLRVARDDRGGQQGLLLLGLQLLLLDLRRAGIAVTYRILMAHIHRIGPVLDAHFPNYFAAGLLGSVIEPSATRKLTNVESPKL